MSDELSDAARGCLESIFSRLREEHEPDFQKHRDEFVFHIAECVDDFEQLLAMLHDSNTSSQSAAQLMVGFLYHVTPHLNAASRLLLDGVPDPFSKEVQEPEGL